MKKLLIVANLKSYKTEIEAKNWLDKFKSVKDLDLNLLEKMVIICPPFTLLEFFKETLLQNGINVSLGAQDVSPFDEGAYTGEVNAKQIKEFCDYVLIGHSERRKNFQETDEVLLRKTQEALNNNLKIIFLIQSKENIIPNGVEIIAYEPTFAIGTGNSDTPENAEEVALFFKEKNDYTFLYGGSVKPENVGNFTKEDDINGVLVGGASLDAQEFIEIIKNA